MKHTKSLLIILLAVIASGCSTLAGKEVVGVVIARRTQVRSSTAVVAADLKEVVRGDVLDILDTTETEGEQWLRVRTRDAEGSEGWIEARNVMPQEMLERSRQLAKEDEGTPAQASGQLRASTNIRLSPDRNINDNILMKLESGARFDIISWKRVPKSKTAETTESDDVPKAGAAPQNANRRGGEADAPKVPEEAYELWYKMRLPSSISPAPAGWVYGKQVELTVPSDIIFYRTGREFVAWQRLDDDTGERASASKTSDLSSEARPGSWVILEKSSTADTSKIETPDFDRIFVLGYDKERQEHYTAHRSPDLVGHLPLRVEGRGNDKTFVVRIKDGDQMRELKYRAYKNDKGLLRVEALSELPRAGKKN